jgi:hypothetical protein
MGASGFARPFPRRTRVIVWLPAVALFPILAATYLGGAAINIQGGGGVRQFAGLMLHYAAFLVAYGVLRLVASAMVPLALAVGLALVGAAILLPLLGRLTFRVVGVKITSAQAAIGHSGA